jgi:hypothetical protein
MLKSTAWVIFPLVIIVIGGCGLSGNPDSRMIFPNKPDQTEYDYLKLARQMMSEKPCYLISERSVDVSALNSPGTRAVKVRSSCFYNVAQRAARPELCDEVKSVNTLLYSGHLNNRESCRDDAERGSPSAGIGIIDHDRMYSLAGFTEDEVTELMNAHGLTENGRYCLVFSREFFDAIDTMPNFGSEQDLQKMDELEWRPHPFLKQQGFPCEGRFMD